MLSSKKTPDVYNNNKCWTAGIISLSLALLIPQVKTVECVYCTEPKATCRQCKNQPNAYNMYTDLEGILSACLYLHVSIYPGVVNFCRYVFPQELAKFKCTEKTTPRNIKVAPAVRDRYLLYAFGLISIKTTCRLGFCPVSTFNGQDQR